jgi:uncharacterized membrane protein SirB2
MGLRKRKNSRYTKTNLNIMYIKIGYFALSFLKRESNGKVRLTEFLCASVFLSISSLHFEAI